MKDAYENIRSSYPTFKSLKVHVFPLNRLTDSLEPDWP
ncbi:hypothetical protein SAMN06296036_112174 [Pseudobacteriovorax antillogorgiicola]|uniref:Uncharacterized protein n=1 Tax=Pseudobacteriovorax antillogorgiicola TaxID=1513793 RepID=A0A1Y6C276_9BACT|nr:hypothetical protein EDD56_112175 [Pseudobacteriovorax antillogorgiicola]SMF41562.1 hypothetical protein SAMN06296036_112174 [Pseudobacteriovorax antillogorgiicola]